MYSRIMQDLLSQEFRKNMVGNDLDDFNADDFSDAFLVASLNERHRGKAYIVMGEKFMWKISGDRCEKLNRVDVDFYSGGAENIDAYKIYVGMSLKKYGNASRPLLFGEWLKDNEVRKRDGRPSLESYLN